MNEGPQANMRTDCSYFRNYKNPHMFVYSRLFPILFCCLVIDNFYVDFGCIQFLKRAIEVSRSCPYSRTKGYFNGTAFCSERIGTTNNHVFPTGGIAPSFRLTTIDSRPPGRCAACYDSLMKGTEAQVRFKALE